MSVVIRDFEVVPQTQTAQSAPAGSQGETQEPRLSQEDLHRMLCHQTERLKRVRAD